MATYRQADRAVELMAQQLIDKHYPDLAQAEVSIELLMAHAPRDEHGNPKGPALKVRGWNVAGTCRINPLKARVAGRKDVEICLDGDRWEEWSKERQLATLDHELAHINVIHGQTDDAFRPKCKLHPHDFECCGFDAVVKHYGAAAFEAEAAIDLQRRLTQMEFAWG